MVGFAPRTTSWRREAPRRRRCRSISPKKTHWGWGVKLRLDDLEGVKISK